MSSKIFVYQWITEDVHNQLAIRAFGINENGQDICLLVRNFKPWIYIETTIANKISLKSRIKNSLSWTAYHVGDSVQKSKLYFDHGNKLFKFYPIFFDSIKSRKQVYFTLRKKFPYLKIHEYEASPLLQFLCKYSLPSCGWVDILSVLQKVKSNKYTRSSSEFIVDCTSLKPSENPESLGVPFMRTLSFDIETYSTNELKMPNYELEGDVVFQIGVSIQSDSRSPVRSILFTLSPESFTLPNITVHTFFTEHDLLESFCEFVKSMNPHILMGYNIFGFDLPYLYHRCRQLGVAMEFIGMPNEEQSLAEYKDIKWSSSAYSVQEFHYLDLFGRLSIDLLPVIRRDYKLSNYKLKTVSTFFLGETKDPLSVKDIFEAYRLGVQQGNIKKIKVCGKYCVQDAKLVLSLFHKLQIWIGLVEMARICNVGVMTLFTQGQQIKVFSQIYRKCFLENRLVDSFDCLDIPPNVPFTFENYCGAFVFDPTPGKYNWIIPFDFTSLYPTTIIAFNIDYSTLVIDESFPDKDCHIIEWKEGTNHYRYRFRKEPIGVIPSLLQSLLDQRNKTKKLLKQACKNEVLSTVYDKRQLAYKVSANSMYGAMGVQKGYLPFLPGAMCTTAKGRESIKKAAQYVQQQHSGKIIYGDSVHRKTILLLKGDDDKVKIDTIENFFDSFSNKTSYPQFKPEEDFVFQKEKVDLPSSSFQIQSRQGWSSIVRVIRHRCNKRLYRIFSSSGVVTVTADHSLLLNNGTCIKPSQLQPSEHTLMTVSEPIRISNRLFYQKETWDGFYTQSKGKVCFDKSMDDKYIAYIYFTFLKRFPNCRFVLQQDTFYLDLFNEDYNIPPGFVYKIEELPITPDFVYDVETNDGSFHAGIGTLIVKNTDSIYCHFPKYKTPSLVWKKAKETELEFIKLFPPPMKLLFEEKIYKDFLILSKKRYMAYTCSENGSIDDKMTIRGVLLARRDNCHWTRMFYERIVRFIMETENIHTRSSAENISPLKSIPILVDLVYEINQDILALFQWNQTVFDMNQFIITKSLNEDYKVKELSTDLVKARKRLQDLKIDVPPCFDIEAFNRDVLKGLSKKKYIQDYILKSKPAHVQLAHRMELRGLPISTGSRMEFVVIEHADDPNGKLGDKFEDPLYFNQHCDILRMDRLYYLKSIMTPLDQLLETVFSKSDIIKSIYDAHCHHCKVMKQLKTIHYRKIHICGD